MTTNTWKSDALVHNFMSDKDSMLYWFRMPDLPTDNTLKNIVVYIVVYMCQH